MYKTTDTEIFYQEEKAYREEDAIKERDTLNNIEATQRMDTKADALERGENCLNCEERTINDRCALDRINKAPRKSRKSWCSNYKPTNWDDCLPSVYTIKTA